ncbi:hypothetical protein [Paenibacillus luteus]|uniref:hypothetical protein n=1 Tax=Paenibacillus luteus TaxID=2545753 RepID=UPI001142BB2A|nr:hypothetical protein [Paenibacillus luteus]
MEQIQIFYYYEESATQTIECSVEHGYLIAPDIAVTICVSNTIYFIRVKPSDEEVGTYIDCGLISDIVIPGFGADLSTLPRESLVFALWAAKQAQEPLADAV